MAHARPERGGPPIALKVAHPGITGAADRLTREAEILGDIGPPTVPAVHESGSLEDGTRYLVLEYIDLPTLAERIGEKGGAFDLDAFEPIAQALLDAVETVHAKGYVHADLTPENVFVSDGPLCEVRLLDLGLSQRIHESAAPGTATGDGTAEYMSPEQCRGDRLDERSDLYSLGVVFFELLTGRVPFWGRAADVRNAHLNRRPPRPSGFAPVGGPLEEVLLACLAKDPAERPSGTPVLRTALENAISRVRDGGVVPEESTGGEILTDPGKERRTRSVGLVSFEAREGTPIAQVSFAFAGGQLVHASGRRCVLAFGAESSGNPIRRAVLAAQAISDRGFGTRLLVDLSSVMVQIRGDGTERFLSAAFGRPERYLGDPVAPGVYLTEAAKDAAPELPCSEADPSTTRFRFDSSAYEDHTLTTSRDGDHRFVGRDVVLNSLLAGAAACIRDRIPAVALVVADVGHGKSRLAAEVSAALRADEAAPDVLELQAREAMDRGPEDSLRRLLMAAFVIHPAMDAAAARGRVTDLLGTERADEIWPAMAMTLDLLPMSDRSIQTLGTAPGVLRSLSVKAAGEALRRRAAQRPLCVLFDDVHHADPSALDALDYAAAVEAAVPLWVCTFARPAFEKARRGFGDRAGRRQAIRLGPLDPDSASELCRELLLPAVNIPAEAVARLVERTQGVPMLLVELVRGLRRQGILRRQGRSGNWFLATDELDRLPDLPLIEWLAERELASLAPDLAAHARLIALLGQDVILGEIEGVLRELDGSAAAREFPLDARVAVRRLLASGLVVGLRDGRFGFRHGLVRNLVARSMAEGIRGAVREAACRFYRAAPIAEEVRLARLAYHAARAGHRGEASAAELQLMERAVERHDYLEAESRASLALESLAPGRREQRIAALRCRGLVRYRVGRYADAVIDLEAARGNAHAAGDSGMEARLYLDEATVWDWMSDFPRSSACVEQARALAGPSPPPMIDAELRMAEGRTLWRFNRNAEAAAALDDAARKAEALGDSAYEVLVVTLLMLGYILPYEGRVDDADRALSGAIALATDRRDRLHLAAAINNRRSVHVARGNVAAAIADGERYLAIGRELAMHTIEYFGEFNLGELLYQHGDGEDALPHIEAAIAIERAHPDVMSRPLGLLLKARFLVWMGDLEQAGEVLERIRVARERIAEETGLDPTFLPNEAVQHDTVRFSVSSAGPAEWEPMLVRAREHSVEQELVEVLELAAIAAHRQGRRADAARLAEETRRAAKRIPNVMGERLERSLRGPERAG